MFTYLFRRGVHSFEARGSVPHSLARLSRRRVICATCCARERLPIVRRAASASIGALLPKRLLIFNTVVMCVYAIGVQASYLASVLDLDVARTGDRPLRDHQRHRHDRLYALRRSDVVDDHRPSDPRKAQRPGGSLDGVLSLAYGHRRLAALAGDLLSGRASSSRWSPGLHTCSHLDGDRRGALRRAAADRAAPARSSAGSSIRASTKATSRWRAATRATRSWPTGWRCASTRTTRARARVRRGRRRSGATASTPRAPSTTRWRRSTSGLAVDPQSARSLALEGDDRTGEAQARDRHLELSDLSRGRRRRSQHAYEQLDVANALLLARPPALRLHVRFRRSHLGDQAQLRARARSGQEHESFDPLTGNSSLRASRGPVAIDDLRSRPRCCRCRKALSHDRVARIALDGLAGGHRHRRRFRRPRVWRWDISSRSLRRERFVRSITISPDSFLRSSASSMRCCSRSSRSAFGSAFKRPRRAATKRPERIATVYRELGFVPDRRPSARDAAPVRRAVIVDVSGRRCARASDCADLGPLLEDADH